MLSGQQPYNADTPMGVVVKHITEPVPEILNMVPSLPMDVDKIIRSSMAKDKNNRYSTAVELAKALNLVAFGNEGNFTTITHTGWRSGSAKSNRGRTGLVVAGIILLVAVVGFFLLRNQLFTPQPITPTLEPTAIPSQVPTAIPSQVPTVTPTLIPATSSPVPFAPACAAGIVIPTPVIKETNKSCVQKVSYTSISIPEGATFESLSPELSCAIETTRNGQNIISCTGKQLFSYNLKVCVPPVVSSADSGKCDQGTTFESANQCCLPTPSDGAGCTLIKVDLRACR
jgi:serine/threonine protein kinase